MSPNQIVQLAKTWALTWDFCDIGSITWDYSKASGGLWYPPEKKGDKACIIMGGCEGIELLFHEAFHSTLYYSPLRAAAPEWREGWCNAFSEVARQSFTPYTGPAVPKTRHDREYLKACEVLCSHVGGDAQKLFRLWAAANRPGCAEVFSQWMGYRPDTGETL